jgi:hypothetical protein
MLVFEEEYESFCDSGAAAESLLPERLNPLKPSDYYIYHPL